ncbi:D-alanyl-D-alanine dipeptidase [Escherichia coli]|uniref:D-alanyl-D-alanine dipeptidase n=1 Tax=Escherichia coli TaxID=562 RepID=A0A376S8T2_ECOLX|nr:D-alanyl-D-alanine dipeptidase [Escherichia coli]
MSDTTELVDLAVIFPDLEIELKYACADNITGKAIYQQARCLLHRMRLLRWRKVSVSPSCQAYNW